MYVAISRAESGASNPGNAAANISVWTAPKAKTLKTGPFSLYSSANNSVHVIMAALLEEYADKPANFKLP